MGSNTDEMRLQLYLARAGIASRRASEAIILDGRVQVNGHIVRELGSRVGRGDIVLFDGQRISLEQQMRYIALNKPVNYICASKDPQGRRLALSLLQNDFSERLYNVGRLDYRSSGLILFSNDGNFTRSVSHPSSQIEKEYLVESTGIIPQIFIDSFLQGINIENVRYQCKSIEKMGQKAIRIVLIEGKNREIRRVFSHFRLHPRVLHRVRIGPVLLGTLESGAYRSLSNSEITTLGKNARGNL